MKIFVLLCMIFCHIIDDYKLQQGVLVNLKQKCWWEKHEPNKNYKNDYLMALFMHSMSWSFMVQLPLTIYCMYSPDKTINWILITFIRNTLIHFVVDDLKANQKVLNLIQDQLIHLYQIVTIWTWVIL